MIDSKKKYKKFALFFDDAKIRSSNKVQEFCKIRGIPIVYNFAYEPKLNRIESLWSRQKAIFRKETLKAKFKK